MEIVINISQRKKHFFVQDKLNYSFLSVDTFFMKIKIRLFAAILFSLSVWLCLK